MAYKCFINWTHIKFIFILWHTVDQIICSFFNITVDAYTKANNNHACCTAGNQFHQRCACARSLNDCKTLCDEDNNCKGYVETSSSSNCQIATTSSCPSGCGTYDSGNVESLTLAGTCGRTSKYYGCFIKGMIFT